MKSGSIDHSAWDSAAAAQLCAFVHAVVSSAVCVLRAAYVLVCRYTSVQGAWWAHTIYFFLKTDGSTWYGPFLCMFIAIFMCVSRTECPLPFELASLSESYLEVLAGGMRHTHTHTDTETHTERLIWHTSSGRRMKGIFKHSSVWRTLIHISPCRAHPAIIKQINWTFTQSSIDLENILVLHSLFLPTLT